MCFFLLGDQSWSETLESLHECQPNVTGRYCSLSNTHCLVLRHPYHNSLWLPHHHSLQPSLQSTPPRWIRSPRTSWSRCRSSRMPRPWPCYARLKLIRSPRRRGTEARRSWMRDHGLRSGWIRYQSQASINFQLR